MMAMQNPKNKVDDSQVEEEVTKIINDNIIRVREIKVSYDPQSGRIDIRPLNDVMMNSMELLGILETSLNVLKQQFKGDEE